MKRPDLGQTVPVPSEVKQAAELGELIIFVGSGVSMRMNLPSWRSFATSVMKKLASDSRLNHNELQSLKALDPRKILSIAKIIDNSFDFAQYFQKVDDGHSDIYDRLNTIGCTFVTTNYDLYLQPLKSDSGTGSTVQRQGDRIIYSENLLPESLDEVGNVIHLHGSIKEPRTMIITTAEYLQHYDNENVQLFLRHLFETKTVVFMGYGLEEAELLEHVLRRGSIERSSMQRRLFSLQGFYTYQTPVYERLHSYYDQSFGLELLGFLLDFNEYECLGQNRWQMGRHN